MPAIAFDRVCVVYGRRPDRALALADQGATREEVHAATGLGLGVHDATLEVRPGEIAVLMGLSGSGKSTLLRAVNGLAPLARGRLTVRDRTGALIEVGGCGVSALRDLRRGGVAMVFQQFALLPWRSVAGNVALGLELSGLPRRDRRARAEAALDLVGLADWAGRPVASLSGGMRQRVGLARALATEPAILLMDEPFSALDPLIRARLQDELKALQARIGCTILFVSHDLEEAVKLGSAITILEGGRIVQTGRPQDIVLRPGNAHVAEFVAHLNPIGVLTARDAMAPHAGPGDPARRLAPEAPLAEALPMFATSEAPVWVGQMGGPVEGRILPGAVCALLGRTGGVVGSETGGVAEASPGREGAPPPSPQPHAAGNPA